ncbi:SWF or SNF family helicase [Streptomyces sp. 3MP-14]|uniref:SWF or SNF family helicase n=1 Tax=Streptomyces mimosae TaxID=2586635 RepID=A0A5N6A4Y4_9ACTN|nr:MULTISPECIES: SWF or SNF family helicase [Streptomyces]KAB8162986.1 SWF or SNF family helicase [Streptomyces mimosae]KAB8179201.1 SWF or SNF family helicase [Streptomyces sp. 3MP-14]
MSEDGRAMGEDAEVVLAPLPPARGRSFADTWWGRAWLSALEDGALDGEGLRRGRRHARAGAVGAVSVRPGRLTSVVRTTGGDARRADVLLRPLSEAEWDRLVGMAAREAGHLAALLDAELPPALVADAAAAGVELLPGMGELEPTCECGEWDHCAHTAALCYQTARLLDADPFLLLLLRGLGRAELLARLRRRSTAPARAAGPVGVPAAEVYAGAGSAAPELPAPPPAVAHPGPVPGLVPDDRGELDVAALEFLAADAARRACRLLAEALAPGHERRPVGAEPWAGTGSGGGENGRETAAAGAERERGAGSTPARDALWRDAVRLAAGGDPPASVARRLAAGCERTGVELALAVRAWRVGGAPALAVLEAPGARADPRALEEVARAFGEWGEGSPPRARGNVWTVRGAGVQLRYGNGRWWPYRRERGRWWPAGPAESDPATALAAAREESRTAAGAPGVGPQASDSKTA